MWICGNLEQKVNELNRLIPLTGSVDNPKENPKLEKFRKAQNVVYDVFNNGLCNRARQVKGVFGVSAYDIGHGRDWNTGGFNFAIAERVLPPLFEKVIVDACNEQGV